MHHDFWDEFAADEARKSFSQAILSKASRDCPVRAECLKEMISLEMNGRSILYVDEELYIRQSTWNQTSIDGHICREYLYHCYQAFLFQQGCSFAAQFDKIVIK